MPLLEIRNLTRSFGGLNALDRLNLDIYEGEILGVIGPNGAGKTTLFNVITGFLRPTNGTITFRGENISGLAPHRIAKKGIIRSFQLTGVFGQLTVLDNMRIGFHLSSRTNFFRAILPNGPSVRRKEADIDRSAMEILSLMGMDHLRDQLASELSHGYHKCLTVAIPLAASPKLLLLDEPVTLLDAERMAAMAGFIHKMRDRGVTIVIVEHHMKTIFGICERIVVLDHGMKLAEGLPEEIRTNKEVIAAYLGEKKDAA
jgi:branched-chain amino acid transport system ATP-binding protein